MPSARTLFEEIRKHYELAGQTYWFTQWYQRNLTNLLWMADGTTTGKPVGRLRILDLGIGWGGASVAAALAGAFVVGVDDFEDDMLNQGVAQMAFLRHMNVRAVRAKLSAIPLKSQSFDVVILNDVVEHMVLPRSLIRYAADLLAADGILILEVPNSVALYKRIRMVCGLPNYHPGIEEFFREEECRGHIREYTRSEVEYMLRECCFQPLKIVTINQAKRPGADRKFGHMAWGRALLRLYDIVSSCRDAWKDQVCALARKSP
jgi:SAM-dependent methyltransferase